MPSDRPLRRRARSGMVGARISLEKESKLRLLAAFTNRSMSDIVNSAIDELLADPSRLSGSAPPEVRELAERGEIESVDAAEYHVRRQALILAFQLTSILLHAFVSWLTSGEAEGQAAARVHFWKPSEERLELGYDIIGAVMRNESWIVDSWISGTDYERKLVSEYLADFTAEDPELAREYQTLLEKIDSAKSTVEEIIRAQTQERGE